MRSSSIGKSVGAEKTKIFILSTRMFLHIFSLMTVPKRQKTDVSPLNTGAKNVVSAAFKQVMRPDSSHSLSLFFLFSHFILLFENCLNYSSCLEFLFILFFNWRTIALQYCVGFCHTSTWISHRYMYVPSFLKLLLTSHSIPSLFF